MAAWEAPVIFLGAFAAGVINSMAGGGTLVSFPLLVWIGRDPVLANTTNTVSLWPGSLAAFYGYRSHLGGRRWLWWLLLPSLAGGIAGALLLLRTPSRVFAQLVPYLILLATALFAAQQPITRALLRLRGHARDRHDPAPAWLAGAMVFQFFVAVYGGYFGAGMGIVMLAALGLLGLTDIHQMNGFKNLFAVCINGIAAVYFVALGAVNWGDVAIMVAGQITGGYSGAAIARRLGRGFARGTVVAIGLAMALSFLLRRP